MTPAPDPALLNRFSEFLTHNMGLYFPQERLPDLIRGMAAATREFQFEDAAECMQWLISTPMNRSRIGILAAHLTVGETYFFREPQVFDALQSRILLPLIQSRRASEKRLRIWSAACSTGEEAYSLAILVQRLIPDYKQWNITILGTDINPDALCKAESGVYSGWSFRNAPEWLREKYFIALDGGRYRIVSQVREMVTFSYLNLVEDSYPTIVNNTNAMDVIFCRNVLMYFTPALAAKVVRQHSLSLADGGCLIVSSAEAALASSAQLKADNFPGAILHRKNSARIAVDAAAKQSAVPGVMDNMKTSRHNNVRSALLKSTDLATQKLFPIPEVSAFKQALNCYGKGSYKEAAEHITRFLADRKVHIQALHLMVRIYANQGELETALSWCERSIAADRVDPTGYYLMAMVLQEQGRPEEAVAALKRTLYLDQEFVLAHFMLGNLCRNQAGPSDAGRHFANTLALLKGYDRDAVLPESEGMTAGRLTEIIRSMADQEGVT